MTLTLEDEIDISRGDLLVAPHAPAVVATRFTASPVWMSTTSLDLSRRYLLKQASCTVQVYVRTLRGTFILTADESESARKAQAAMLGLNDIGVVELESLLPIAVDSYQANRHTGSFILIDPETNSTIAAGMVRSIGDDSTAKLAPVSPEERATRWGHTGARLQVSDSAALVDALERALFDRGAVVVRFQSAEALAIAELGALVITQSEGVAQHTLTVRAGDKVRTQPLTNDPSTAVTESLHLLYSMGVLSKEGRP